MSEQVYTDFLTGIYNRNWLFEKSPVLDKHGKFSLLYMDLDNFKTVNDVYGHEEGDRVLKCTADALSANAGEDGYPIRMSGDEFVLLFSTVHNRERLSFIYGEILKALFKGRAKIPGISVISVSAGAVMEGGDDSTLQDLLNMGDDTMYVAKRSGKRRCVFYEDIRERAALEHQIASEAPEAIQKDLIQLEFCPLLNMQSSMLEMTQVIPVWVREDGTRLLPDVYRSVLENNGFIRELDIYILEKLFQMLDEQQYSEGRQRKLVFSIELSRLLFLDRQLEYSLQNFFRKYKVTPKELDISVTEEALGVRDSERMVFGMGRIADLGITLSVKNFGVNFMFIRYINTMRVSTVYFEPEWVMESLKDHQNRKTIRSIVRLIKDAHNKIVVLGEPDASDKRFLARSGCDALGERLEGTSHRPEDYAGYIEDKIPQGAVVYEFQENLEDSNGKYPGKVCCGEISYVPGVSDGRMALHFSGGEVGENVVELPASLFSSTSYTIAMWIYPETEQNWTSVIYMRYEGGFTSYVPYTNRNDGLSCYRLSSDNDGFFDTHCRAMPLNEWCHIVVAFDAADESVRYFINGRRGNMHIDQPTQIGCRQVLLGGDPFQRTYTGSICSLKIFDYALSDDDITALYKEYTREPGYRGAKEDFWMEEE